MKKAGIIEVLKVVECFAVFPKTCLLSLGKEVCETIYYDGCLQLLFRFIIHYPACEIVDDLGAKVKINCIFCPKILKCNLV